MKKASTFLNHKGNLVIQYVEKAASAIDSPFLDKKETEVIYGVSGVERKSCRISPCGSKGIPRSAKRKPHASSIILSISGMGKSTTSWPTAFNLVSAKSTVSWASPHKGNLGWDSK